MSYTGFNMLGMLGKSVISGSNGSGWKELGRTSLGIAGDTITVSSLPNKRYYMFLTHGIQSGSINHLLRFNNDSGTNYANREMDDGATETTNASTAQLTLKGAEANDLYSTGFVSNFSSKEKIAIFESAARNTAGAGNAPSRRESVGKWANTVDSINRFDIINNSTGDFAANSELIILGWDPADTHTTDFWEELASINWASGGSISSGTITAKKYLWIQGWGIGDATAGTATLRFNGDTATNYALRRNSDGGSELTDVSQTSIGIEPSGIESNLVYINALVVNRGANEKLVIGHTIRRNTAGAGTAPNRAETVGKWANTTDSITSINFLRSAGNFTAGHLWVWGAN